MRRMALAQIAAAFVVGLGVTAWAQGEAAPTPATVDASVHKLISEGGYYYSVGQFQKAADTADAALKLDPNSASARELKTISLQAIAERDQKNWVREERKGFFEGMDQIKRDMVVPRNVTIDEGPRWPLIKKRGATVYGPIKEIEAQNREIYAKLETTVVTVDFKGQPLKDAAAFLANQSKLNIQVDPRAKVGEKSAADTEVTFQGRQMKAGNVLAWITRLNGLQYTVRDEVILITDKTHMEDFKVTAVYDISDITAPITESTPIPEFDMTLPSINARRIGEGFYRAPEYWYWHGMGPFTGTYFLDFATVNRYFMTDEEVKDMVDALIEGEEK